MDEILPSKGLKQKIRKIIRKAGRLTVPTIYVFDPIVKNLIKGKKVLDIGCAGGDMACIVNPAKTVHAKIANASRYCVGIDIREDAVRSMKEAGFNVFLGDAERFDLQEKDFDIVRLGDVIEHLSNPGLCLSCANHHLKMGGKIVINTPNPTYLLILINAVVFDFNKSLQQHPGHTCFFTPSLLSSLLVRYGFKVKEWRWTKPQGPLSWFMQLKPQTSPDFIIVGEKISSTTYESALSLSRPSQLTPIYR